LEVDIFINGCKYRFTKRISITQLVMFLNCSKNAIAVEYNQSIIKQEIWPHTLLRPNDNLEFVTIVGGG
jgi:thiamine biosynthesis protein ThiS